jgi:putative serine protease PepD
MQSLLIEVDGRALRFDAPRLLRIGRSIEADVVLAAGSVSRQHAELRPVENGWVLVDSGSQYGTYVDGRRVTEHMISGQITVQCGPPAAGSTLRITPDPVASAPSPAPVRAPMPVPVPAPPSGPVPSMPPPPPSDRPQGQTPPGGGYDETFILAAQPPGPPGSGPARTGPDLLVVAEGREFRFRHPAYLTVGRRPESDVVVTDPVCSRMHGQVTATPGGWTYTNSSQEGTFLNGRRVEQLPFRESVRLRLGHPVAGPELALVPILSAAEEEQRFARKRRNRTLVRVAAGVAALVLIGGTIATAVLLSGSDDDPSSGGSGNDPAGSVDSMEVLTNEELDTAKAATVRLSAETTDLTGAPVEYSGSGSIIDEQGLILTNAHVAAPEAEGLAEQYGEDDQIRDPEYLLVALTQGDDRPADPEYRARVVEADGNLDAAVVEIYADEEGNELDEELDLPTMPIGDSDELRTGDDVTVLGFPGISQSGAVTVTKGVVSTFIPSEEYGPRSEIDTDTRIAPGNSGGAAINNDAEIIGIPSAFFSEGTPIVSGRIRPINLVKDLIEAAEAAVG